MAESNEKDWMESKPCNICEKTVSECQKSGPCDLYTKWSSEQPISCEYMHEAESVYPLAFKRLHIEKEEAVKQLQEENEKLRTIIKDLPDHNEVDALYFELNLSRGKVRQTKAEGMQDGFRESLMLIKSISAHKWRQGSQLLTKLIQKAADKAKGEK